MTCPPEPFDMPTRPSLSVDWEVYAAMLETSDMPLDQQRELIETLWSIVVMFVDLGYDLKSPTQSCGEDQEALDQDSADLVSLLNREWAQTRSEEENQWQESAEKDKAKR
ncbi:hypothetical protein [Phaeobacter inhibens]|uniref:hypothetical protein n=1 Tax=Phaeobacter inhibens TaxID=221822 RepID=UPI00076BB5B9|nr:hypothetical protein [Phaeobacter inhibens]KXF92133.1 hypothetical protein AT574_03440 [Phaeobacter inhibens]WHP67150.1 hypothetical protein QMZ01_11365 [Phaeobacter inhibens]